MTSVSVQRVSELIRGVIELLWNRPDGLPAKDLLTYLPEILPLTASETAHLPASQMPRYERTLRIASEALVKAGWLIKTPTGYWLLTQAGRDACKRFSTPQELFIHALQASEDQLKQAPEFRMVLALIREQAWNAIANFIRAKNRMEVRRLLGALLEAMQYYTVWVAPPHKDHGLIDLVANIDPLGAKARRVLVQVKHTGQPVTLEGLKSFSAVLGANDFGLLFSTGGFTAEAKGAINKGGYQKINAMDLEKFYEIWLRHYDRLSHAAHRQLPLTAVFFLDPPE
jgi:restriction system protein